MAENFHPRPARKSDLTGAESLLKICEIITIGKGKHEESVALKDAAIETSEAIRYSGNKLSIANMIVY